MKEHGLKRTENVEQATHRLFQRFRAGTLLYALLVVVVLAATSMALISLSASQQMLFQRDQLHTRLNQQVTGGTEVLLYNQDLPFDKAIWQCNMYQGDTLFLERRCWGFFDLLVAKAWHQTDWRLEQQNRFALAGRLPDSVGRAALYLSDNSKPLALAGNTALHGSAYLPRAGLRPGYVNMTGFTGANLLDGQQKFSSPDMPRLDEKRFLSLQEKLATLPPNASASIPDSSEISFDSQTLVIHQRVLQLQSQTLRGNIMLVADSLLWVGPGAQLEDVILTAPVIQIDSGFNGTLQAIATRTLLVGKNVRLNYPSVLALWSPEPSTTTLRGSLGENSLIEGLIFCRGPLPYRPDTAPRFLLAANARLVGQAYVDGWLQLSGTIYGNASCRNFTLETSASIYDNYILDATIDARKLPKSFAGPMIYPLNDYGRKVVKWVK
ncbi:MAG: hypothetical protein IT260_23060 [Saprospiraceae bacterium]|nr:hypothetical protein [Saprospiraceae bacterium]